MNSKKKNIIKVLKIINNQKQLKNVFLANTKKKIVMKTLKYCDNYVYSYPPYNYRDNLVSAKETLNMFNFVNNYFYGSCHEINFFAKYIFSLFKIKTKILHMNNLSGLTHLALEVLINNKKIFIDPTLGLYFYGEKQELLSYKEIIIRLTQNKKVLSNKKISLNKFKNLNKKNYFFYKNKISFLNPRKKYFSLFKKITYMELRKNDYKYKKKLREKLKIKDFYFFKSKKNNFKNLISKKIINNGSGIISNELINSNKVVNFKNIDLAFINNKFKINIKNFIFNILDFKLIFDNSLPIRIKVNINKLTKVIYVKNNTFMLNQVIKSYKKPIRDLSITSNIIIKSYVIRISKSFYNYGN